MGELLVVETPYLSDDAIRLCTSLGYGLKDEFRFVDFYNEQDEYGWMFKIEL